MIKSHVLYRLSYGLTLSHQWLTYKNPGLCHGRIRPFKAFRALRGGSNSMMGTDGKGGLARACRRRCQSRFHQSRQRRRRPQGPPYGSTDLAIRRAPLVGAAMTGCDARFEPPAQFRRMLEPQIPIAETKSQQAAVGCAPARPGIALKSGCTVWSGGRLTANPRAPSSR
jgi:hypothetical protein